MLWLGREVVAELLVSRSGADATELFIEKCGPVGQKPVLMMLVGVHGMAVSSKASIASAKWASFK